jgi:hypothetical protein
MLNYASAERQVATRTYLPAISLAVAMFLRTCSAVVEDFKSV